METIANAIAVFFVLHFVWSYYFNCYRKGYTVDVWHFTLLSTLFVTHVMLPFIRSDLNIFALGYLLQRTQAHITEAYLISALGYACILAGGNLWRLDLGFGLRSAFSRLASLPSRGTIMLLDSKPLLMLHGLAACTLVLGILLFYFRLSGFGFNLRSLLLTYPPLRPIAQFAAFYCVLIGSLCLARYWIYRERAMLGIIALLMLGLLFFGERANIVAILVTSVIVGCMRMRRRLKLWWFVAGMLCVIAVVFLLDALREPNFSLKTALANLTLNIFYGNTFSDTRDFAVVLSSWDGHYLHGLTYLAGLLAFVPRFLSSFRDTWAIGVVTAGMAGFKPTEHPGLRVGMFGEAYLNFGLIAVVLMGLLVGATVRLVDLRVKHALLHLPTENLAAYSYYIILVFLGAVEASSNASANYSILIIFLFSWLTLRAARFLSLIA